MSEFTRRRFLVRGSAALVGAATLSGCAGRVDRSPRVAALHQLPPGSAAEGTVAAGHFPLGEGAEAQLEASRAAMAAVLTRIADPEIWLNSGERVFIKLACNSPNDHPAVTSPDAVVALVELLQAHGAEVIVGDQSGVEHVRLTEGGERVYSTREAMAENGLADAVERSGATLHCFDDEGWDGYRAASASIESLWDGDLYLPRVLDEVDHVINLTRLSAHALAGYTAGIKTAVGWLRDDSRRVLHQEGKGFWARLAEISLHEPLRDKLRATITCGPEALLNIGPDFGAVYDLDGVLAFGSTELVDHDLMASALVWWLERHDDSFFDMYRPFPEDSDYWNRNLVENTWGEDAERRATSLVTYAAGRGLAYDPCLAHFAVKQGRRPWRIALDDVGVTPIEAETLAFLDAYGNGIFATA